MTLSVGTLNGGINALLLLVHLVLALLAERTYSLAARAQLHLTRATAATDVSQLHISHWGWAGYSWLRQRLYGGRRGVEGKTGERGGGAKGSADATNATGMNGGGGHDSGGDAGDSGGGCSSGASWDMRGSGDGTAAVPDRSHSPRRGGGAPDGDSGALVGHGGSWSWAWVVALAAGLVALFPAELVLETGIDTRRDCAPASVMVVDGVCASPSRNVPDAAASVAAILAAHLDWVDKTWTVVPEGAAKSMVTAELRVGAAAAGRVVAANCALTSTPCTDVVGGCGEVVVQNTGGSRGFVTVDSSLMPSSSSPLPSPPPSRVATSQWTRLPLSALRRGTPVEAAAGPANSTATTATAGRDGADALAAGAPDGAPANGGRPPAITPMEHGDLVYTSAFFFWPETPDAASRAAATARGGSTRTRIATRGVEAVLTEAQFGRVMLASRQLSTAPLTFPVLPAAGRVYTISCDTDGLDGGDLAAAASIYRAMQMSHPTGQGARASVNVSVQPLPPPLTVDAVLRGAFAWKAVDTHTSCEGPTVMYTECGVMDWHRAVPLVAVTATLLALYVAAVVMAWDVPRELHVPTNAAAWQRLAMASGYGGGGGGSGGDGGGSGSGGSGSGRGGDGVDGGDADASPWGGCPHCLAGGIEVDPPTADPPATGSGGHGGGGTAAEPSPPRVLTSPRGGAPPSSPRGGRLLLPLPGSPVAHQTPHGTVYVVLGDA